MYQPKHIKPKKISFSYERKCQIVIGVVLLILSALIVAMASIGLTTEERDITPVVFIAPLGLYLILTKNILI